MPPSARDPEGLKVSGNFVKTVLFLLAVGAACASLFGVHMTATSRINRAEVRVDGHDEDIRALKADTTSRLDRIENKIDRLMERR